MDVLIRGGIEPCLPFFHQNRLACGGSRINAEKFHACLGAIEGGHHKPLGRMAEFYAGDILRLGTRKLDILYLAGFHVIGMNGDCRIFLSGNRIFVSEFTRIERIFFHRSAGSFIKRERERGDLFFVVSDEAERQVVRRPAHRGRSSEFLLVGPVGNSVDNLVSLAVSGYCYFRPIIKLLYIDIVIGGERYHSSVRREYRRLLARMFFRKWFQQTRTKFIDVIFCRIAASIYHLPVDIDKKFGPFGTHGKSIYPVKRIFACLVEIHHGLYLFSAAYIIFYNPFSIG